MKNIYILRTSWGSYEDECQQLNGWVSTKEEAKKYLVKMGLYRRIALNIFMLRNSYSERLRETITQPPRKELMKIPKWKAGIGKEDITPEMRAERDRIININKKIREDNHDAYTEYRTKFDEAMTKWLDTNTLILTPEEKAFVYKWKDNSVYLDDARFYYTEVKKY